MTWQRRPPGEGWFWHRVASHVPARPHRLVRTGDGLLRTEMRHDRHGHFMAADMIGGWWWTGEINEPKGIDDGEPKG